MISELKVVSNTKSQINLSGRMATPTGYFSFRSIMEELMKCIENIEKEIEYMRETEPCFVIYGIDRMSKLTLCLQKQIKQALKEATERGFSIARENYLVDESSDSYGSTFYEVDFRESEHLLAKEIKKFE